MNNMQYSKRQRILATYYFPFLPLPQLMRTITLLKMFVEIWFISILTGFAAQLVIYSPSSISGTSSACLR